MPDELSVQQVRLARAAGQCLYNKAGPGDAPGVVGALVGINAQRTSAMMLSLRARMPGLERASIDRAIDNDRSLVRTWAMRGTLHLLNTGDIRWLVAALGPGTIAKTRRRRLDLGLDDRFLAAALERIKAVMRGAGPMTRWELIDALASKGMVLERKGQAPVHLIMYAALMGLVCLGPERENGEATYVLLDEWLARGRQNARKDALATLAGRYLRGYGPATLHDFSAWSGVSVTQAREAWDSLAANAGLREVRTEGKSLWMSAAGSGLSLARPARRPQVRLLPAFDSYVLAYQDRELLVRAEMASHVYHGGQTLATIVVDGEIRGVWKYARRGKRLVVELSPFKPLDDTVRSLVADEVRDVGRFLELETEAVG